MARKPRPAPMFEAAPVNTAGLEVVAEALAPVAEPIIVELLVAIAADEELIIMTLLTEAADEAGAELAGAELAAAEEPLTAWAPVPLGQSEGAAAATFNASLELQVLVTQEVTPDW
jgi:ethanolamine transporter EutH